MYRIKYLHFSDAKNTPPVKVSLAGVKLTQWTKSPKKQPVGEYF